MDAPETFDPLADLRAAGLSVTLEAGKLIVRPATALTDDLRRVIRDRRTIILAALNTEAARERAQAAERAAKHRALVAELTALVRVCGEWYGFTKAEHADALACALADPAAALECFRAMVAEEPGTARTAPAMCPALGAMT